MLRHTSRLCSTAGLPQFAGRGRLMQKYDSCRTAFLCCDIQDRLRPHIKNFDDAVHVSNSMSELYEMIGRERGVFIATEQAPKFIGHIAKDIKLPPGCPPPFAKIQPSMLIDEVLPYIIGDKERGLEPVQQAVLWGHETQVCIINTADDLLSRGIRVAILCDGTGCQRDLDHQVSLQSMASWPGLVMTTVTGITLQLTKADERFLKQVLSLTKNAPRVAPRSIS